MSTKRRRRHSPAQIVRKLRDADAMLTAGKDLAAVFQSLEVSESTLQRWRLQYGGIKSEKAVRLKTREDEKELISGRPPELGSDILLFPPVFEVTTDEAARRRVTRYRRVTHCHDLLAVIPSNAHQWKILRGGPPLVHSPQGRYDDESDESSDDAVPDALELVMHF